MIISALACMTSLSAQKKPAGHPAKASSDRHAYLSVENDSSATPPVENIVYSDGNHYRIKMRNDKLVELFVDDQKIPEADFRKYDSIIKKIREQIKKDLEQAEIDRQQAGKDRQEAELDRKQADEDRKQADEDRKQAEEDRERSDEDRKQSIADRKQAEEDREQAEEDRKQSIEDRKQADVDREQAKLDKKRAEEDKALVKSLVADLIASNIIKSEKELSSLVLKEGDLLVNDKKQPDAIYQKFKIKYLKNSQTEIRFNNTINHRGLSVYSIDNDNR